MKENIKHFKNYSIFIAVVLYISGILGILGGIGTVLLSFFLLASSVAVGPIFGITAFLIYLLIGLVYIAFSVFAYFVGNQYLKRGSEAQELLELTDDQKDRELTILKSIERREFWIERLLLYPSLYGGAAILIATIIFAPVGVFMILSAENQRKMDLLKDKYNFNTIDPTVDTKVVNSEEIFEHIKKKTKFDAWGIIASIICFFAFLVILIGAIAYLTPQFDKQLRTTTPDYILPTEFER